jgi:hypothetical protein
MRPRIDELAVEILRDLIAVPPGLPLRMGPGVLSDRPSRDLIPDTVIMAGPEKYPVRGHRLRSS